MVTVVHSGDTHLGYQQYHKPERERDFMDAFRQTVDAAINREVDAYIHAGDLFENPTPAPAIQREVIQLLNRLDDNGIRFLAVVGNHDRATRGQWLDLFEEAGCGTHLGREPVIIDDVAFYGLDYMGQARRKQFDYNFAPSGAEHSVLVGHGQFAPLTPGDWDLEEVLAKSTIDFDVVLLGDEHQRIVTDVDGVPVTYSGSTERTATDQTKPRTFNTVTFDGGVQIDKYHLDTRPFEQIDVSLDDGEGFASVRDEVEGVAVDGAVVRITITGDGEQIAGSTIEEYVEEDAGAFYAIVDDKREFDREIRELDVDFADPDEAVKDEVEGMELSTVMRDLEREVRDESVAKSNLKGHAKREIEAAIDENPENLERPTEVDVVGGGDTDSDDSEATEDTDDGKGTHGKNTEAVNHTDGGDETTNDNEDGGATTASLSDFSN